MGGGGGGGGYSEGSSSEHFAQVLLLRSQRRVEAVHVELGRAWGERATTLRAISLPVPPGFPEVCPVDDSVRSRVDGYARDRFLGGQKAENKSREKRHLPASVEWACSPHSDTLEYAPQLYQGETVCCNAGCKRERRKKNRGKRSKARELERIKVEKKNQGTRPSDPNHIQHQK